jgi:Leucine-rich repeat (LRR) protein
VKPSEISTQSEGLHIEMRTKDGVSQIVLVDDRNKSERTVVEEPSTTLLFPPFERFVSLAPDGGSLVYVTADNLDMANARLWHVDTSGKHKRQLAVFRDELWVAPLLWSPNGRMLAIVKRSPDLSDAKGDLELWTIRVSDGKQTRVLGHATFRSDLFLMSGLSVLAWTPDSQRITYTDYFDDEYRKAVYSVRIGDGHIETASVPLTLQERHLMAPLASLPCGVSQFSQNSEEWKNDIMQTCGLPIGDYGCAVTSVAMVFRYYGVETSPRSLNQCLGDQACGIHWDVAAERCDSGKVNWSGRPAFSYGTLESELNSGRPPIVELKSGSNQHFVVVISGSGSSRGNYQIIDPWDGQIKSLSSWSSYGLEGMRLYSGTPWCDDPPPPTPTPPTPTAWRATYDQGHTCWWDPNCSFTPRCTQDLGGPELHKDWGNSAPCGGMDGDNWVGIFESTLSFSSGRYAFRIDHDDGLKLFLNGNEIVQRSSSGSSWVCDGSDGFSLGGNENLKAILREDGGDARVNISWSTDTSHCAPPPRDEVVFVSQSPYPTVSPGESFTIFFEVENTGNTTWRDSDGYGLENINGVRLGAFQRQEIGGDVPPGARKRWDIQMTAPSTPDTYRTQWMLNHWGQTFGPNMFIDVTVREPAPSPPSLRSPQDGDTLAPDTGVVLAWNSSNEATEYHAHLWGGPGIDINSGWTASTDWHIGPQWLGTYQWQVRARNGAVESDWSPTWSFTVSAPDLEVVEPLALSPSDPLAGEEVEARFTIKNTSGNIITLQRLLVGVHGPDCPDWACPAADFHHEQDLTLQPGQEHAYSHKRVFAGAGEYMIVALYVDSDGRWQSLAEQSSFSVSSGLEVVQALTLSPAAPLKDQIVTARYTIRNLGTRAIGFKGLGVVSRGPDCSDWECPGNVDFPVNWDITLQPNQEYHYSEQRGFYTVGGGYFAEPAFVDTNDWWYPFSGENRVLFSVAPGLEMVEALSLSPANPMAGEEVQARMVIRNASQQALTLQRLLVGVHGPDCATWECSNVADFYHEENLTLQPGEEHTYTYSRVFPRPGEYMVVPLYVDADGFWHSLETQSSFVVSPGLEVVRALSLSPSRPVAGQLVTASYDIRNSGSRAITVPILGVVARGPDCTDWNCSGWVDFPTVADITLQPGAAYTYTGQRAFDRSGTGYFAEPARADSNTWYYPIEGGSPVNFTVDAASAFCADVTQIPEVECLALESLYQATNGVNWAQNQGWMANHQPCTWHGVVCNSGHVIALDLEANQLEGSLPSELSYLSHLVWLVLNDNQLAGPIPSQLAALNNLHSLHLTGNQLSGEVPAELGDLGNLKELGLGSNQLGGRIPAELGNLASLERLWLDHNALSGAIPPELGGLTNLQHLVLGQNQLSGAIPPELGNAQNLQILTLWVNQLTGVLPPRLMDLGNLEVLALSENRLSGTIPAGIGSLTGLKELYLNHNQFTGTIPAEIGNLTDLTLLSLNSNQLTGEIPTTVGNMARLQELHLDDNQLGGPVPSQLASLTNLWGIWLHKNQLSGDIPAGLGNLANLEVLHLGENQLAGSVPATLGNLSNLRILILWANQLTGSIPGDLGSLSNLELLHLGENQLQGVIPPEIGNLTGLNELGLGSNQLSGQIPPGIGNLASLQKLWLDNNVLEGSIPASFSSLASLQHLVLGSNRLDGAIPSNLGNLSELEIMILWENELIGSIPSSVGNLTGLKILGLSGNDLSGTLPAELGMLTQLEELYLNENHLEGAIPAGLANLVGLRTLSLGNNALNGEIPALLARCTGIDVLDVSYNMLTASDPSLIGFLSARDSDWKQTQTVPPEDVAVTVILDTSVELTWSPIGYVSDGGYYEIAYLVAPGSDYVVHGRTSDKTDTSYLVDGLQAGTDYGFAIRTFTPAHGSQTNTLYSTWGQPVSATPGSGQVCYELDIAASPESGGTVRAEPPPNCGDGQYASDSVVRLTAEPHTGFAFDAWTGAVSGSPNPAEITITGSKSVTAHFVPVSGPMLRIPDHLPAYPGSTVRVPVQYSHNLFDIASLTFSIDFDQNCLVFDPTDNDGDGVPDSMMSHQPGAFGLSVAYDGTDPDGEVDVLLADLFPPLSSLVDGELITIDFGVVCEPEPGETIVAPIGFSNDPQASFGDTAGRSIPGLTSGGAVEIQTNLIAGDCNNDHVVDAGDVSAVVLEIFDGDGLNPADTPGGTFVGNPGCDANSDSIVDAGDISCTVLTIFGGAGACAVPPEDLTQPQSTGSVSSGPELFAPLLLPAEAGAAVTLPITFTADGEGISSLIFSIDYAQEWLSLNPADEDGDGIPDSVSLDLPSGFDASISVDQADENGELDVFIGDLATPMSQLPDGVVVHLTFDVGDAPEGTIAPVRFSEDPPVSFGSVTGQSIPGQAGDGSILIESRGYRTFIPVVMREP